MHTIHSCPTEHCPNDLDSTVSVAVGYCESCITAAFDHDGDCWEWKTATGDAVREAYNRYRAELRLARAGRVA